jgi:ABC-type multidrug transport system ATPase subunit
MTKLIEKSDILLFNNVKSSDFEEPNGLKKFTNLIKFTTKKKTFKFSFSNGSGSLHKNITIRENLDLEAIPTSISLNDKLQTKEIIANISNPHLQKMISRICPLERLPAQLNPEEFKLASLVKGILSQTDYLFLDSPDRSLSATNLELVKKCLQYEANNRQRIIIISPINESHWIDIANKVITKSGFSYEIINNNLLTDEFLSQLLTLEKVA